MKIRVPPREDAWHARIVLAAADGLGAVGIVRTAGISRHRLAPTSAVQSSLPSPCGQVSASIH